MQRKKGAHPVKLSYDVEQKKEKQKSQETLNNDQTSARANETEKLLQVLALRSPKRSDKEMKTAVNQLSSQINMARGKDSAHVIY